MLEALARGLTQKMLHGAMVELNTSDGSQREQVAQAVSRLFLRDRDGAVRPPPSRQ